MTADTGDAPEAEPSTPAPPEETSPPQETSRREVGGRDLPMAIVSGVVLATAFLVSLFWNPAAIGVVAGVLVVVAVVEASRVLAERTDVELATPILLVVTLVSFVGAHEAGEPGVAVGVVVLFLGAVLWELVDGDRTDVVRNVAATVMFGLWVPVNASYAVLLVGGGDSTHTPEALLAVAGGVIFTDIGGFAFGVNLGRHKIVPSVSPGKSWEGLIGGLALTGLLAAFVLPAMSDYDVTTAVFVALLAGVAGFIGDLVESMFKRDLGVKDLGDVIPGHGGILDRVDGLLLALPVGYYTLRLLS